MTKIIIEKLFNALIYDSELPRGQIKSFQVYVRNASKARDIFYFVKKYQALCRQVIRNYLHFLEKMGRPTHLTP